MIYASNTVSNFEVFYNDTSYDDLLDVEAERSIKAVLD